MPSFLMTRVHLYEILYNRYFVVEFLDISWLLQRHFIIAYH